MTKEEYFEKRINVQQQYFSTAASKNKKKYQFMSLIKLILSLGVTVISANMSSNSLIVSISAATISLIEGVLLLFGYNDNWITYRETSEKIKSEEYLYETKSSYYKGLDETDAFNTLVENIESIVNSCNCTWKEYSKQKR